MKIRNVAGKRRLGMKAAQAESARRSETFAAGFQIARWTRIVDELRQPMCLQHVVGSHGLLAEFVGSRKMNFRPLKRFSDLLKRKVTERSEKGQLT